PSWAFTAGSDDIPSHQLSLSAGPCRSMVDWPSMIVVAGRFRGLFAYAHRRERACPLCRRLSGLQGSAAVGRDLRHPAGGRPRVAAGGGHAARGPGGGPGTGAADLPAVRGGHLVSHHQAEATTRQRYWYCLRKHILPEFGPMKMAEILPEHVREWVT